MGPFFSRKILFFSGALGLGLEPALAKREVMHRTQREMDVHVKKSFFFVFSFSQESFELEMTFFCIYCTIWLSRKRENRKEKKIFFYIDF